MNLKSIKLALAASALIAVTGVAQAQDKPEKLTIISHKVHETVSTGAQGGDITKAWQEKNGVGIEWVTLDTNALHERLFRELQLPETSIDIAFVLNTRAVESVTKLLEPLSPHQEANPIEDIKDIFPGLIAGMTFNDTLYGIPFRHASSCFHYNARILKERGVEPPKTMEELIAAAHKLTFDRADGTKVYGFVIAGDGYANTVDLARTWNGDFITTDYKVATTDEGMMNAVQTLADFYKDGVLPKNWAAIKDEEINNWIQTGRAAMTTTSCGRNRIYNDKEKSQEAGNIKTVALPVSEKFKDKFDVAPAKVEFWTMVIPKNSKHKDLAWDLIKTMASKESTLMAALNGNGPVRASTYDEDAMKNNLPYAAEEKAVLLVGRVPVPPFDDAAKASDIFVEDLQAAVLGMMPVEGRHGRRQETRHAAPPEIGAMQASLDMSEALSARELPRLRLAQFPTPLELSPRLGAAIGCPGLLVKREDLSGLGLGGNKPRQLEVILADAERHGCDTIVTTAAAQSNFCRATAAACAQIGWRCVLLLRGGPDSEVVGNLLLDHLFGADDPLDRYDRSLLRCDSATPRRLDG